MLFIEPVQLELEEKYSRDLSLCKKLDFLFLAFHSLTCTRPFKPPSASFDDAKCDMVHTFIT